MDLFRFDNQDIFYRIKGEGKPLLLLHGNSVSSNMFRHDIEYFSRNFRTITFDYPGHGKSGRLSRFRDDFWNYNAKCASKLMEILSINKYYAIGTSGGALVGLNLAIIEPANVNKLIVDSFLGEYLLYDEARLIVEQRTESMKNSFMAQQFWKSMHGMGWKQVVENDLDLMLRVGKENLPLIIGNLNKINSKVLGIASTEDELIPNIEYRLKAVCNKIPDSKYLIYNYGKHPFMTTQKDEFRRIADNFLLSE